MDISLTEDQTMIADTVREVVEDAWPREVMRAYADSAPAADDSPLWKVLAASDFHTMLVAPELGGSGASVLDALPVLEQLGYGLAPTRFATSAVVSTTVLGSCRDSPLRRELLSGTARLCTAVVDALSTRRDDGGIVVSGNARFVPDLAGATHVLPVAPELVGVVDLDLEPTGVQTQSADLVDATRRLGHLRLDDVVVDADHLLTPTGTHLELAATARRMASFALVCDSLGGAQRALDLAVAYAKERHQFGRPIGSFQALQHLLADAYVAVENLRSATWYAGWALDRGSADVEFAVLAASVLASDTYLQTADLNIQVHGGMGFTREVDAYLFAARAKVNELLAGSQAERLARIATWLQTAELEPLVDYLGGNACQIQASMFASAAP